MQKKVNAKKQMQKKATVIKANAKKTNAKSKCKKANAKCKC